MEVLCERVLHRHALSTVSTLGGCRAGGEAGVGMAEAAPAEAAKESVAMGWWRYRGRWRRRWTQGKWWWCG